MSNFPSLPTGQCPLQRSDKAHPSNGWVTTRWTLLSKVVTYCLSVIRDSIISPTAKVNMFNGKGMHMEVPLIIFMDSLRNVCFSPFPNFTGSANYKIQIVKRWGLTWHSPYEQMTWIVTLTWKEECHAHHGDDWYAVSMEKCAERKLSLSVLATWLSFTERTVVVTCLLCLFWHI